MVYSYVTYVCIILQYCTNMDSDVCHLGPCQLSRALPLGDVLQRCELSMGCHVTDSTPHTPHIPPTEGEPGGGGGGKLTWLSHMTSHW